MIVFVFWFIAVSSASSYLRHNMEAGDEEMIIFLEGGVSSAVWPMSNILSQLPLP